MRAVILILILVVVAAIIAIATGLIDINQTRSARVPAIEAGSEGVTATGGQTPSFDVETGSVSVGAQPREVTVPVPNLRVNPADGNSAGGAPVSNEVQPVGDSTAP